MMASLSSEMRRSAQRLRFMNSNAGGCLRGGGGGWCCCGWPGNLFWFEGPAPALEEVAGEREGDMVALTGHGGEDRGGDVGGI